ncbi:hypothetical protein RSOLAG22IIIB_02230 [Rhizoctonia solani]|uniref:Uncharacterized protein n=1 Tax=Rhizoctonia solani TaxID=456999 RepID=A0A0K6GDR3_9AGAM|nr:hypothetical protein RSOLAG22IIIB_02230 [Rhizoctonia solani]
MSLNDLSIRPNQGTDVYDGVTNPTSSSIANDPKRDNFVTNPTSDEAGAGAGPGFQGGKDAEQALKHAAGVVEAHPGILEGAKIAPLSDEEPEFGAPSTQTSTAASTLSGGAKIAYGTVTGNQTTLEQGKQEYYGENH